MAKLFVLILFLYLPASLWAQSAARPPGADWKTLAELSRLLSEPTRSLNPGIKTFNDTQDLSASAYYTRTRLKYLDFNKVNKWTGTEDDLKAAFERVRDRRFLRGSQNPNFPRRLTWLFPDDGCYIRAGWMARMMDEMGYPTPSKVFIFGSLKTETPYHSDGYVSWWYHVAIIYNFNDQLYVFDPSIEASKPELLADWAKAMTLEEELSMLSFAVCDSETPGPHDLCYNPQPMPREGLETIQNHFLPIEWSRLLELKMNPEKLLGDEPPWLKHQ